MCDNDKSTVEYFSRHIKLMNGAGQNASYINVDTINGFFSKMNGEK